MNKKFIKNVVVSGGTHGNEYTGAFLARQWMKHPASLQRSTFQTHPVLANPQAFQMCRRYVERDLNRSFHPSGEPENPNAFELARAKEIEIELIKKCEGALPDVIFDLHSTTAHMGSSLVLTNTEPFNILLYAYLRGLHSNVNAYLWEEPQSQPGFFNSLSRLGFAIEVGPVANGVLDAEWVSKTNRLVQGCLDFIEIWNRGEKTISYSEPTVPLYRYKKHIDYPRADDGLPAAMIHPDLQGNDFELLQKGEPIFLDFDGETHIWEGEPTWPVFINEAAYYEKGIAFTATERIEFSIANLTAGLATQL